MCVVMNAKIAGGGSSGCAVWQICLHLTENAVRMASQSRDPRGVPDSSWNWRLYSQPQLNAGNLSEKIEQPIRLKSNKSIEPFLWNLQCPVTHSIWVCFKLQAKCVVLCRVLSHHEETGDSRHYQWHREDKTKKRYLSRLVCVSR